MGGDGRHCQGSRVRAVTADARRAPARAARRAAVALLAIVALLLGAAVPPASAAAKRLGERTLAPGSRGNDVRTAQRALTALRFPARPVDGIYGRRTALAVRRWERARRQRVDGRLSRVQGRRVRKELLRQRARNGGGRDPAAPGEASEVGPGASAGVVARAQQALTALRFAVGAADGTYGESTAAAIGEYQGTFFERRTGRLSAAELTRLEARVASVPAGDHTFPIAGSWQFGSSSGRFGDDRGTHAHGGQDMAAASGTPLVAVTSGVVAVRQYQASGAGNYVVLRGDDGIDYVYMHMLRPATVAPGARVTAGQRLGQVGTTGRSTGPHLHFEMWTARWFDGGEKFDPLPALLAWR